MEQQGNVYNIYFVQYQDAGSNNMQVMKLDEELVKQLIDIIHKLDTKK